MKTELRFQMIFVVIAAAGQSSDSIKSRVIKTKVAACLKKGYPKINLIESSFN